MKLDVKQLKPILAAASRDLIQPGLIERCFLFGSSRREDGELFHRGSDIDLLLVFSPSAGPTERVTAADRILVAAKQLAFKVASVVKPVYRDRCIISIGAVTPFELKHGIDVKGNRFSTRTTSFWTSASQT